MPNAFAFLILGLWPLVSVGLFRALPAGRALLASLIVAYLFLPPPPAAFDFPLIPPMTKETLPSLSVLLICLIMYRGKFRLLPDSKLATAAVAAFVCVPVLTTFSNLDPVFYGRVGLPGMGVKDAVSLVLQQFILITPMLLARAFLADDRNLKELLIALSIAGLVYSLPMLVEVRLSPQLNIWIYGYFQHNFEQMVRYGGFRPIVFLYHGLWVAFFAMTSLVSMTILFRSETGPKKVMLIFAMIYMATVLILCKSAGSILYAMLLLPLLLVVPTALQLRIAVLLAVLAIAYPTLKAADLIPEATILQQASRIDAERAGSLQFRLENENILLDRALERPIFGWGSWGRNHILDPVTGRIMTVTDGLWVITLGVYGWVGFFAQFLLMTSPILLLWTKYRNDRTALIPPYVAGMCLLLAVNILDLMPNATLTPITWLMAGALLGYAEKETVAADVPQRKPKMKLRSIM
ncbi:Lipid A core-O-antigen ligase [Thalassovita gelatinovora]|uniref:Lipid A core-O-antigen ligase n=1 Tax=Thalassovita gelatinovora TaxID=53501 RepID=A0A0P1F991_THAGE|nr:hypothetical protein [Thalassovita gelatinovora]CUH64603.1 Lipid A core-O-antigen ligase [Thalassovita gelatinovora]SEP95232.1 hypothetical protein SAMN04488043_102294 [Thalassovita gelatinovora]